MIEPFNKESGSFMLMADKLNEVITELNNLNHEDDFFESELYALINTWKSEAAQLDEHPEMFPGFSPEVCKAIARDKIHCCSELLKLIEENS